MAAARGIATRPVVVWHLALLPAVLAANYLFFVLRHEGSHALVARAFGAEIADFHWWPPRGPNFSWITFGFPAPPSPLAVPLQAWAPYVVAVGLLVGSWVAVGRALPPGLLRANVVVTGILFPCAELVVNAVGYWYAPNDLYYALGARTQTLCALVQVVVAMLVLASAWVVIRTVFLGRRAPG